jgi:hypothetical protein
MRIEWWKTHVRLGDILERKGRPNDALTARAQASCTIRGFETPRCCNMNGGFNRFL